MSKKIVPFLIAAIFGLLAYFVWKRNKGLTLGSGATSSAVPQGIDAPPVLTGFTGTAANSGPLVDSNPTQGMGGFSGSLAQTKTGLTSTSGGFSGTAAVTVPQPPLRPGLPVFSIPLASGQVLKTNVAPSTGPSVSARSGRGQF